jgi:phage baseplate assembly protein W
MAIYNGFSTINVNKSDALVSTNSDSFVSTIPVSAPVTAKKFRLTDNELVVRDLMNALSIKQGEKPGKPEYGTTIWSYVFEPSNSDTQQAIETEIRRVASLDPRITMNNVTTYLSDNEVLIQLEMTFTPFNEPVSMAMSLGKSTGTVSRM